MGRASVPTPTLYPAFFFVLEKGSKSAGNAVIPTYPMHRSHGLQGFLKRCYTPLPYFHQWVSHIKRVLSQSSAKTAHVRFHERKRVHTLGSAQRIAHNGSHAETGAVSDGGAITTLGAFHTFRKPCVARCQNGKLCRFWVLVGGTPEGHREPAEQRCALMRVAVPRRRGPAGLRNSIDNVMTYCYFAPLFVANISTVWYD